MRPAQLAADLAAVNYQQRRAAEFIRTIRCFATAALKGLPPAAVAERAGDQEIAQVFKDASPAARLSDLPGVAAMASAFATTMRGRSAVDTILPSAVRVPWRSRIGIMAFSGGGTPAEARAKPVGRLALLPDEMQHHKASAIAVLSNDLLTAPDAPIDAIRAELAGALATAQDGPFVQHLLSGVTPITSTGDPESDVFAALNDITRGAGARLVWLAGEDAFDQWSALPEAMTPRALSNVALCDAIDADALVLVDASQVAISDAGVVPDMASHAALEMDDEPHAAADSPPAPAQLVSLWQTNSAAIRLERELRYKRLTAAAVAVISGVSWFAEGSPA